MEKGEFHFVLPPIELEKPLEGLEPFSEKFLKDRITEFTEMKRDFESKNLETVKRLAHNWKGFSEPYGFAGLGTIAEALEQAAKNNNTEACFYLIQQVNTYLQRKKEILGFSDVW